ncbi:hypothetical protein FERRO_16710 [Ferrovum sp. JA12]|uniref:hypothetical protein n=1 Tax=Ferrovum sp. JA12 TaxID=1356299 RepID=UPI00070245E7|nr:hypothetical protein [Ferrovum sp. JA12]KRH78678.1 hypothetical protein FERRO_16710 [Ferrovum sp. JA12]
MGATLAGQYGHLFWCLGTGANKIQQVISVEGFEGIPLLYIVGLPFEKLGINTLSLYQESSMAIVPKAHP